MKRFVGICSLALLVMFCLSGVILAQPESFWFEILISTFPGDSNEFYGAGYSVEGEGITLAGIRTPTGKVFRTEAPVLNYHSEALNFVVAGSYSEFNQKFPVGEYKAGIRLDNGPIKSATFHVTHTFPDIPVLIYPTDGQTGVSLTPLVQWEQVYGIDDLDLEIEGGYSGFEIELSTDATSYQLPAGILEPNTEYSLMLSATMIRVENRVEKASRAIRWISFTTGTE